MWAGMDAERGVDHYQLFVKDRFLGWVLCCVSILDGSSSTKHVTVT